jgi:Ni,Fe-hydrogenase maturation factor
VDSNYQLCVEDAISVRDYDTVILMDATVEGNGAFVFDEVQADREAEFSTHLVLPGSVLAIAREFFHAKGRLFTMAVRAEDIRSMEEGLTPAAAENLDAAEEFLRGWIDGRSA